MPSLQADCLHSFDVYQRQNPRSTILRRRKTKRVCIGGEVMRKSHTLLVFVAILLSCEPSHTGPVKTVDANDPVQTCSEELPVIAEFRGTNFAWIAPPSGDLL